jgi:hypothetical protein
MREILFFEKMIAVKALTFLYWLLLIPTVVGGVGAMVVGSLSMAFGGHNSPASVVGVGVVMVLAALFIRVFFEVLVVVFKIHDNLKDIHDAILK